VDSLKARHKKMTKGNDPAIAHASRDALGQFMFTNPGLTKREYFAAMASAGLTPTLERNYGGNADALAIDAVHIADALIEALNK
jgi:hypothetical protein